MPSLAAAGVDPSPHGAVAAAAAASLASTPAAAFFFLRRFALAACAAASSGSCSAEADSVAAHSAAPFADANCTGFVDIAASLLEHTATSATEGGAAAAAAAVAAIAAATASALSTVMAILCPSAMHSPSVCGFQLATPADIAACASTHERVASSPLANLRFPTSWLLRNTTLSDEKRRWRFCSALWQFIRLPSGLTVSTHERNLSSAAR
mmetsp:Transcript_23048/g.62461  ORF Transcript_23048/g.62461 Transcript_23048/m.62461 type:complete len:210 (+) Transcript_23048:1360-1989(+)